MILLMILGIVKDHEAITDLDSRTLPKQCSVSWSGISCQFKRLRNGDSFPFLKAEHIVYVFMAWNTSCSHPYVELPDTTFSEMPNVGVLRINGCVKRRYTSRTFQGSKELQIFYHVSQPQGDYFTTFEARSLDPLTSLVILNLTGLNARVFPKGHFCKLQHLDTLGLTNNLIQSSDDLGIEWDEPDKPCLPNLTLLDISLNPIPILNFSFSKDIPKLKVLTAKNCSISQIIGLDSAAIMGLQELNLSNNNLSILTMENPEKCINSTMKHLDLHDNHLRDISPGLFMCTRKLKYLNMSGNRLNEVTLLDAGMQYLTGLEYLNLNENNISSLQSIMFEEMTGLHEFSCNSCGVKRVSFQFSGGFKKLHTLDLSNNDITEFSIAFFDNLKYIRLVNNKITYVNFSSYMFLDLQLLDLSRNLIQQIHGDAFYALGIQSLNLDFNNISDPWESLSPLHHLSHLHLQGNRIQELHRILRTSVEWIDLSMNQISYIEPGFFALRSLKFVNLTYNELHHVGNQSSFQALEWPRPEVYLEGNYLLCDCNTLVLKISTNARRVCLFVYQFVQAY